MLSRLGCKRQLNQAIIKLIKIYKKLAQRHI